MKLKMASTSAETPLSACPVCDRPYNAASAVNEPGIYQTPIAGDTTVCADCLTWLVFRDDLSVREMTQDEADHLEPEERRALMAISKAIEKAREARRSKVR